MEIEFYPDAQEDQKFWKESGNKKIQGKITKLINSILEDPFKGIGKPEALKHELSGRWSRRINEEHRIVYKVEDGKVFVYSIPGHYEKNK